MQAAAPPPGAAAAVAFGTEDLAAAVRELQDALQKHEADKETSS